MKNPLNWSVELGGGAVAVQVSGNLGLAVIPRMKTLEIVLLPQPGVIFELSDSDLKNYLVPA
jgi:hypothetical protein